jgi:hypothetical protein
MDTNNDWLITSYLNSKPFNLFEPKRIFVKIRVNSCIRGTAET